MSSEAVLVVPAVNMVNRKYRVEVYGYVLAQFRIKLIREGGPDPLGDIVRELCTYQHATCAQVVRALSLSDHPERLAQSYAKPWNCEGPGGRIRLDNTREDRPEQSHEATL